MGSICVLFYYKMLWLQTQASQVLDEEVKVPLFDCNMPFYHSMVVHMA